MSPDLASQPVGPGPLLAQADNPQTSWGQRRKQQHRYRASAKALKSAEGLTISAGLR